MNRFLSRAVLIAAVLLPVSCAWVAPRGPQNRTGSTVEFLYPEAREAPRLAGQVTTLRPPVRVGLAFVPGGGWDADLPEAERERLLGRIRDAFRAAQDIGPIEVIPSTYLRPKGGFENLDQVARMFNLDLVVLLSYDQVQFNDARALSVLYWTLVGAYVIEGDQYDVHTLMDAAVVDVASRKLLFRAPGASRIQGSSSAVKFSAASREARIAGFEQAVAQLIPNLEREIARLRERVKTDPTVKVVAQPGSGGAGGVDAVAFVALLAAAALRGRRPAARAAS